MSMSIFLWEFEMQISQLRKNIGYKKNVCEKKTNLYFCHEILMFFKDLSNRRTFQKGQKVQSQKVSSLSTLTYLLKSR